MKRCKTSHSADGGPTEEHSLPSHLKTRSLSLSFSWLFFRNSGDDGCIFCHYFSTTFKHIERSLKEEKNTHIKSCEHTFISRCDLYRLFTNKSCVLSAYMTNCNTTCTLLMFINFVVRNIKALLHKHFNQSIEFSG